MVIFSNLALNYFMAIVSLKDCYDLIKTIIKVVIILTLFILKK